MGYGASPMEKLMIVPKEDKWVMRNEKRDDAVRLSVALLATFLNPKFTPDPDSLLELKKKCGEYLDFGPEEKDIPKAVDGWWRETLKNLAVKS
jgi:hypothetical protein